jgi:ADP-ribose pyrophosphatase
VKLKNQLDHKTLRPWKTLSRETLLDCGKYLVVESHTVELPDGRVISDWPWLVTPDYVNIVAVNEAGHYLCFRQTKYSVDGESFAPFGGFIEPGEDPLRAAQRELIEEGGFTAREWFSLGHYPVDGNRGAGKAHFFLARGAYFTGKALSDDLEEQHLVSLSRSEVEAALAAGQFKLLPWATCVLLALLYQDQMGLKS